mmetsp:Transcript_12064/g.19398  ORF Transcript_12064/g.19398 Transcript_12064/m.19398 type:complete len:243 (+) Transcript_12064:94-822(+)
MASQYFQIHINPNRVRQAMLKNAEKLGGTILKQEQSTSTSQPLLWNHAVIPPGTDLSSTPLEVILDVATGGYVATCGPLNALCLEANFYQLWTREYVQHLGDYLLEQSRRSSSKKTIIIDVGAGDGLLIQCLRDYMIERSEIDTKKSGSQSRKRVMRRSKQKKKPPTAAVSPITTTDTPTLDIPTLVATDDTSWGISVKAKVEKLSVEQASIMIKSLFCVVGCPWVRIGRPCFEIRESTSTF